jgi:hypothetical protein
MTRVLLVDRALVTARPWVQPNHDDGSTGSISVDIPQHAI